MTWLLVFMICKNICVPSYAETYPNKQECLKHVDKEESFFHRPVSYCIPMVIGEAK